MDDFNYEALTDEYYNWYEATTEVIQNLKINLDSIREEDE